MSDLKIIFYIVACSVIILLTNTFYLRLVIYDKDVFNSYDYNMVDVHNSGLTRYEINDKNFDIDIPRLI